jgi:opacity protein-like surface antigen
MKKILVAAIAAAAFGMPAIAADMPVKAPPMGAPAFSWTGCYLGGNVGGAWGRDSDWEFELGGTGGDPKYSGAIGGGQIGCDYQNGPWVVGLAGMFDWSDLKGHAVDTANPADHSNTKVHSLATATARVGYAIDRSLLYIDGGAAWTSSKRFFTDAAGALAGPVATTEKAGGRSEPRAPAHRPGTLRAELSLQHWQSAGRREVLIRSRTDEVQHPGLASGFLSGDPIERECPLWVISRHDDVNF